MTNKELQALLKKYPTNTPICIDYGYGLEPLQEIELCHALSEDENESEENVIVLT